MEELGTIDPDPERSGVVRRLIGETREFVQMEIKGHCQVSSTKERKKKAEELRN